MPITTRTTLAVVSLIVSIVATGWALWLPGEAPADFTFINNTEVASLDPALVTGQPEGRVLTGLFEGLVGVDPRTLAPLPGVAERWEVSADKLVYTFYLRETARWSDGSSISAQDIQWSLRRFLDPFTASQYSKLLWDVKNAERYSKVDLKAGDAVEVELPDPPAGARPHARGSLIYGDLMRIESPQKKNAPDTPNVFVVALSGKEQRFAVGGVSGAENCRQVLLDFRLVGIHVLDQRTLQITLTHPTPYFLSLLGFYPLSPVQPKCVETHGSPDWRKPENIVSNGPYNLHSRRLRDRIRLVKSPTYWNRDHVRCNSIDILPIESESTSLNLYLKGQVDWITSVPLPIIPELLAQGRTDFQPNPELSAYFYRFNVTRPPLNDPRVRRALALAVDKREIVEKVIRAGDVPADTFVPPGFIGYESAKPVEYDPAQAKALLAEAGFPGGRGFPKLPLLYNTMDAHQMIAELIQDQWKRTLGIATETQNMEWGAYLEAQRGLKYSVCRAGWGGDYLDPNTFLDLFVSDNPNNQTGWKNTEYDRLIAAASQEADPARRMKMFQKAETILLEEMPIIPIYFRTSKNMVRPYVHGFYPNLLDMHPLGAIWVDEDAKRQFLGGGGK